MAKKYLALEEAAAQLGIGRDALNALRERGEIRGFADRGTWKFKAEDVDELNRTRQAASDPELPLLSDSAIESEEDELGAQATVIRDGSVFDDDSDAKPGPSDSDVRLILDDSMRAESDFDPVATSDSDVQLVGANLPTPDSDSDVQLVDSDVAMFEDSDSDVRLATSDELMSAADSDSDVRLIAADDGAGDSDVRLVGSDSDSDVRLTVPLGRADDSDSDVKIFEGSPRPGSDSDVKLIGSGILSGSDSDVKLIGTGDSAVRRRPGRPGRAGDSDSEVALIAADGSGLVFDTDDDASSVFAVDAPGPGGSATFTSGSGILGPDDSGINLESLSSGIELEQGSGVGSGLGSGIGSEIGLAEDEDAMLFDDASSITFADEASGIALEADDGDRTMPDLDIPDFGDDDDERRDQTDFEVTAIVDEADTGETFNLALDEDADDEDPFASGGSGPRKAAASGTSATFDLAAEDDGEEEYEEDAFDDAFDDDEELEVAADIDGEDDELDDLDVFDEDDDFDDDFESGGLAAPAARGMQAPVEQEWGPLTFTMLTFTFLFLSFGGMLAYDLVRSMWAYDNSATIGTGLLQWFASKIAG
jgi:excisionase family DNA binding protein